MLSKFLKLPTEQKVLLVGAVVVILVGLLYHSTNYPHLYARMGAGIGRMRGSVNLEAMEQKCKVVWFKLKNCGHCEKMIEEWDKFRREHSDKFVIEDVEASNLEESPYAKEQITGFPTIKVYPDGGNTNSVEYLKTDRTADSIAKFAMEACKQNKK